MGGRHATARFTRLEVLQEILRLRMVPIFTSGRVETAIGVAAASDAAGARVLEFTNRGENAYPIFTELARSVARDHRSLILGVGTIFDAPTAALFIAAGANFVVSSVFDPEVARLCNRRKIAYLPGCGSATEISAAEESGAEIVKLFPSAALGPAFIRAVLGPSPWSRIMPTGVPADADTIRGWLDAGAAAVGIGGGLITDELLARGGLDALPARLADILSWTTTTPREAPTVQ